MASAQLAGSTAIPGSHSCLPAPPRPDVTARAWTAPRPLCPLPQGFCGAPWNSPESSVGTGQDFPCGGVSCMARPGCHSCNVPCFPSPRLLLCQSKVTLALQMVGGTPRAATPVTPPRLHLQVQVASLVLPGVGRGARCLLCLHTWSLADPSAPQTSQGTPPMAVRWFPLLVASVQDSRRPTRTMAATRLPSALQSSFSLLHLQNPELGTACHAGPRPATQPPASVAASATDTPPRPRRPVGLCTALFSPAVPLASGHLGPPRLPVPIRQTRSCLTSAPPHPILC